MSKMTKEQRRTRIEELVGDVTLTREDIVGQVVEESGVTANTVNADLSDMYPEGLPDVTPPAPGEAPTPALVNSPAVPAGTDPANVSVASPNGLLEVDGEGGVSGVAIASSEALLDPVANTAAGAEALKASNDKTGELSTAVGDSLIAKPQARAEFVPEVEIGRIKPEDYEVPKGEESVVHVQAERTNFNNVTGEKKSRPEIIKVNARQWPLWKTQIVGLGYSWMVVLHAPEGVDRSHNVAAPASAQ